MSRPEQVDLQRLFDLSVDLLFVSAADTRILAVNPAVISTLGYSEAELIGKPFLFMIHPDDLEATMAEVAAAGEGQTTLLFECRCFTASGAIRWFQVCSRAHAASGRIYASVRDVTHQRQDRERMQRYADLLERTQAELKGALDELTRVANTDQLTGLMNRRAFDAEAREHLARASRQGRDRVEVEEQRPVPLRLLPARASADGPARKPRRANRKSG